MLPSTYKPWPDVVKLHHSDHCSYYGFCGSFNTIYTLTPWASILGQQCLMHTFNQCVPPRSLFALNMMDCLRILAKCIVCHCWATHSGNLISNGSNWLAVLNTPYTSHLVDTTKFIKVWVWARVWLFNQSWLWTIMPFFINLYISPSLSAPLPLSLALPFPHTLHDTATFEG